MINILLTKSKLLIHVQSSGEEDEGRQKKKTKKGLKEKLSGEKEEVDTKGIKWNLLVLSERHLKGI